MRVRTLLVLALIVLIFPAIGHAAPANPAWTFQLLEGSYLTDDCTSCFRPTIPYPMRGSFKLTLLGQNPLFSRYQLQEISFTSGTNIIAGSGTFQIGGEVAVLQEMVLDVTVNSNPLIFTNEDRGVSRTFPLIQISLIQTPTPPFFFRLDLTAAPFREIWFSTVSGFTSAKGFSGAPGDLLSASGRVVKSNRDLLSRLGFMPVVGPMGIDSIDIGPGGEIFFSLDQSAFSETLGPIQHGDLLSNHGRIVSNNQTLLAAFQPGSASFDYGLDAAIVKQDGEVLFSVRSNVVSGSLKTTLQPGDILSSRGHIVKRNADLLARFHPSVNTDVGLDALYVWPNGEVWFSTEQGFQSLDLGQIQAGDLLSDQGVIVYRNLELLSAFAPLEDTSSFGLDALFIVTDATPPTQPPSFLSIVAPKRGAGASLQWTGPGRVFQVEKSDIVTGPFVPAAPIQPDLSFDDPLPLGSASFYRLHQW
jgi:hypothetical protein